MIDKVDADEDELDDEDEDFDVDDLPALPSEAGKDTAAGFEPDDDWLKAASRPLQHTAMRRWFFSRYTDPAMETPYNSAEGGYLYISGGPYEAAEELYARFGDVIDDPDDHIQRVVDDVESEGISEWAPIRTDREDEYDDRFDVSVETGSEPLQRLKQRLQQQQQILDLEGTQPTKELAKQLVLAAMIGALEAFLYEVAFFWIDTDDKALRAIVTGLPKFREEKITLADIFKQMDGLKARVKGHLQATVWHRWEHVAQIYRATFDIQFPSYGSLDAPLLKRHDIVHRSGHNKEGIPVVVTDEEISELSANIEAFAVELEKSIGSRGIGVTEA